MKNYILIMLSLFFTITLAAQNESLSGKKLGVIGDSYVKNHREPIEYTWHYLFAKKYGMQYYNYGRNGNCVSMDRAKWGEAMYKRYKTMRDSLDYIIIIAGHNDADLLDSMGIKTYKKRASELCKGLITRYPNAEIFWFTCWNNENPHFLQVVDATIQVCKKYHIPVFDAARNSNIQALDDSFRDKFFQGSGHKDHAHLNKQGHELFFPVAEDFILKHLNDNKR